MVDVNERQLTTELAPEGNGPSSASMGLGLVKEMMNNIITIEVFIWASFHREYVCDSLQISKVMIVFQYCILAGK